MVITWLSHYNQHLFLLQFGRCWAVCGFDSRGYGRRPRKNQPGPTSDIRSDRGHRVCGKPVDHKNSVPGEVMDALLEILWLRINLLPWMTRSKTMPFIFCCWTKTSYFHQTGIRTQWLYSIVLINIFGAFFGMMTSRLLFHSEMQTKHEKEKVSRTTGLFAMFGEWIQHLFCSSNLNPAWFFLSSFHRKR